MSSSTRFDVAIIGAGPAGAACAALCAARGWQTLVLEKDGVSSGESLRAIA
jgi:flavin-dependent dehydrogenase